MFDIQRYPAAQETEKYADDASTVLAVADKFGHPAANEAPALISGDLLKLKALSPQFKQPLRLLGNLAIEEACHVSTLFLTSVMIYPSLQHWRTLI